MKTIWKYPLKIEGEQQIEVPEGSRFLSVINQDNLPVLYYLVETETPKVLLDIIICGTGQPHLESLDNHIHLGSVSTHGGKLIWHIFTKGG